MTTMTFEEFKKNRPKKVTGTVMSKEWGQTETQRKPVTRTFYYKYSKWEDRIGWYNMRMSKSITDEVAYQLYLESL